MLDSQADIYFENPLFASHLEADIQTQTPTNLPPAGQKLMLACFIITVIFRADYVSVIRTSAVSLSGELRCLY